MIPKVEIVKRMRDAGIPKLNQKLSQQTGNIFPEFRDDANVMWCKKVSVVRPGSRVWSLPQGLRARFLESCFLFLASWACWLVGLESWANAQFLESWACGM